MKYNAIALTLVGLGVFSQASMADTRPTLTFLTWEDYIDQSIIDQWEKETGIPVQQVFYDDEAQRNLILTSGSSRQIDLAVVDRASVKILSSTGHIYPVREERGRELFWPDACGTYGRQYFWGTYGIVYREDKLDNPVTTWKELLEPRNDIKGHIGMLGQADELITSALFAQGIAPDANEEEDLKLAFEALKRQSPYVVTYDYIYTHVASSPIQTNVWVAPAYSGDHYGLNELQNTEAWRYVAPNDGTVVWIDCLSIVSRSALKAEAQQFIDFLSKKEISAKNSESLWVASPYPDVKEIQSKEIQQDETVYLAPEQLKSSELFSMLKGRDILQRTRIKDALIRYHDSH